MFPPPVDQRALPGFLQGLPLPLQDPGGKLFIREPCLQVLCKFLIRFFPAPTVMVPVLAPFGKDIFPKRGFFPLFIGQLLQALYSYRLVLPDGREFLPVQAHVLFLEFWLNRCKGN